MLVFSKTAGFRHDSIPAGIAAIQQLGTQNNFTVDATEDAAEFTDANLARYKAVIWLSTTGDVLNADQQAAFERYIRAGGGYAGVHAASDTEYDWPWYGGLVGAYFTSHPAIQHGDGQVEDPAHPSTRPAGGWNRTDEWYNFRTNPRGEGARPGQPGRDAATRPGRRDGRRPPDRLVPRLRRRPLLVHRRRPHPGVATPSRTSCSHLLGGIETAAGVGDGRLRATLTSSFEKVTLDSNTSDPMELDVAARRAGASTSSATGGVQVIKPTRTPRSPRRRSTVFTGNEDGLLGITLDPNFATNHWVYLYYAPDTAAATAATCSRAVHASTATRIDLRHARSSRSLAGRPTQRNTCCHAGGDIDFDAAGNLYLATGDNTNPFESDGYAPLDERAGRQPTTTRSAAPATPTTCAARSCGSSRRPTAHTPSRPATCSRPAPRRPGPRSTRWASATRSGSASTRRPTRVYVGDYGPDAGAADPNRGPAGTVEWNIVAQPATSAGRTARRQLPLPRLHVPVRPVRRAFNCAAPVNNSPNNTGLTNLPPASRPTVDYDYDGNPLLPRDRRRRRADGRPGLPLQRRPISRPQVAGVLRRQGHLRRVEPEQDVHAARSAPTAQSLVDINQC